MEKDIMDKKIIRKKKIRTAQPAPNAPLPFPPDEEDKLITPADLSADAAYPGEADEDDDDFEPVVYVASDLANDPPDEGKEVAAAPAATKRKAAKKSSSKFSAQEEPLATSARPKSQKAGDENLAADTTNDEDWGDGDTTERTAEADRPAVSDSSPADADLDAPLIAAGEKRTGAPSKAMPASDDDHPNATATPLDDQLMAAGEAPRPPVRAADASNGADSKTADAPLEAQLMAGDEPPSAAVGAADATNDGDANSVGVPVSAPLRAGGDAAEATEATKANSPSLGSADLDARLMAAGEAPASDEAVGLLPASGDGLLLRETLDLSAQVEALIFAAPQPIKALEIWEYLQREDLSIKAIVDVAEGLREFYANKGGGFRLEHMPGKGYQFQTVAAASLLMERMFSERPRPLSRAAQETLAIIAYRQPVTRADIEFIRGVDAGSIIKNLLERELIQCVGRREDAGRPMLFGTTDEFLKVYRLTSLGDMPPLEAFQPASDTVKSALDKIGADRQVDVEAMIAGHTPDSDEPYDEDELELSPPAGGASPSRQEKHGED